MSPEFWAAVVGALIGGGATLAGSILVERSRLTREMRIRLYDELLPALLEELHQELKALDDGFLIPNIPVDLFHACRRAAVVAGRRTRRAFDPVNNLWKAWVNLTLKAVESKSAHRALEDSVEVLQSKIEKQIR